MSYAEDEGSGRPKLSLQPRGSLSDSSPSPAKSSKVRGGGLCGSVVQLVCAPRCYVLAFLAGIARCGDWSRMKGGVDRVLGGVDRKRAECSMDWVVNSVLSGG